MECLQGNRNQNSIPGSQYVQLILNLFAKKDAEGVHQRSGVAFLYVLDEVSHIYSDIFSSDNIIS